MENSGNPAAPTTAYKIDNPEEFARNMLRLFEQVELAMFGMLARSDAKISPYSGASEVSEAAKTVSDIFLRMWLTTPPSWPRRRGRYSLLRGSVEQLDPSSAGQERTIRSPSPSPATTASRIRSGRPTRTSISGTGLPRHDAWAEDMLRAHRGPR